MKLLFENKNFLENGTHFGQRIVLHNGKKFRIRFECTDNAPCTPIGGDWYHELSVLTSSGNWEQIEDAKSIGSKFSHYNLKWAKPIEQENAYEGLCKDFEEYIEKVYSE